MPNNKGSILAITIGFALVFTIFGLSAIYLSGLQGETAERQIASTQAFWLAEAGIQKAFWEMDMNDCKGCYDCYGEKCVAETLSAGDFDATINTLNSPNTIVSTGSFPNRPSLSTPKPAQKKIQVSLIPNSSPFAYGVFAQGPGPSATRPAIRIGEGSGTAPLLDSYDSSKGNYGASYIDSDGITRININSHGDIGTNSSKTPAVAVSGDHTIINGNIAIGGTNPDTGIVINGTATVNGTESGGIHVDLPGVPEPTTPTGGWSTCTSCSLGNNEAGSLGTAGQAGSYTANALTLNSGSHLDVNGDVTLYITGNVKIGGMDVGAQLNINSGAKLTLYVQGKFEVGGTATLNNVSKIPSKLSINCIEKDSQGAPYTGLVHLTSNSITFASIYAPNRAVVLDSSAPTFYGAVVGKTVDIANNFKFHYDEVLKDSTPPSYMTTYSIRDWQEI